MAKIKAKALADGVDVWCQHEALVPTGELTHNPRNPNTHPQRQVELLAKNIRHFGWRHPITVSRRSGFIVAGHGRLMAAKHLGLKIVPVDYQDYASDSDELAVLVADNRLAELATVDLNELEQIANEWKDTDFDTLLAGFEPADLQALLGHNDGGGGKGDDDDRHNKDLDPSNVSVSVGLYRFQITRAEFDAWTDSVKQDAGFDKESVIGEIKSRLGL